MEENKAILFFGKFEDNDINIVSRKFFDLNLLYTNKLYNFKVPSGFVLSSKFYDSFFTFINPKINFIFRDIVNSSERETKIMQLQKNIIDAQLPAELGLILKEGYESLNVSKEILKPETEIPRVVARMALIINSPETELNKIEKISFLNIVGVHQLERAIKACYASLFSTQNLEMLLKKYQKLEEIKNNIKIAVLIQKLIIPDKSGKIDIKKDSIKISAVIGMLHPSITPETYIINPINNSSEISHKSLQEFAYFPSQSSTNMEKTFLPSDKAYAQKLTNIEISKLMNMIKNLQEIFKTEMSIEYIFSNDNLYLIDFSLKFPDAQTLDENIATKDEKFMSEINKKDFILQKLDEIYNSFYIEDENTKTTMKNFKEKIRELINGYL